MAEVTIAVILDFLRSALQSHGLRVEKLVLFGSQARGTAREDSDLDVAVVSPDFAGKDIFERVDMTARADRDTIRRFVVPLDLVLLAPDEYESRSSPVASFAREGRVLYEAQQ
jgi:predicted nucleotidyltransferase